MKIQNTDNISNKGLYFIKKPPIIKENIHFADPRGFKISDYGARYIEDDSREITPAFKRFFIKNPLIETMKKTKDIFVQYFGELFNENSKEYKAHLRLYVLEPGTKQFKIQDFVEYDKKSAMDTRVKLIKKVNS